MASRAIFAGVPSSWVWEFSLEGGCEAQWSIPCVWGAGSWRKSGMVPRVVPGAGPSARAGLRSPDPSCCGALILHLSGGVRQPSLHQWPSSPSTYHAGWPPPGPQLHPCILEQSRVKCCPRLWSEKVKVVVPQLLQRALETLSGEQCWVNGCLSWPHAELAVRPASARRSQGHVPLLPGSRGLSAVPAEGPQHRCQMQTTAVGTATGARRNHPED